MRRFAVDIIVQPGEYDAPTFPVNTFLFTKDDYESFEIKDVYDLARDFIAKTGDGEMYDDLKVESVECGFCIHGYAHDENGDKVTRRFYLKGLRVL